MWRAVSILLGLTLIHPALASGTIGYGSREGMEVSVISMEGLDTAHAVIHTKHTRENAMAYCKGYVGAGPADMDACIDKELATPLNDVISANCTTGEFTDFSGTSYKFLGPNKNTDSGAQYAILNLATQEIADGSEASGYQTNLAIFGALCPTKTSSTAPAPVSDLDPNKPVAQDTTVDATKMDTSYASCHGVPMTAPPYENRKDQLMARASIQGDLHHIAVYAGQTPHDAACLTISLLNYYNYRLNGGKQLPISGDKPLPASVWPKPDADPWINQSASAMRAEAEAKPANQRAMWEQECIANFQGNARTKCFQQMKDHYTQIDHPTTPDDSSSSSSSPSAQEFPPYVQTPDAIFAGIPTTGVGGVGDHPGDFDKLFENSKKLYLKDAWWIDSLEQEWKANLSRNAPSPSNWDDVKGHGPKSSLMNPNVPPPNFQDEDSTWKERVWQALNARIQSHVTGKPYSSFISD